MSNVDNKCIKRNNIWLKNIKAFVIIVLNFIHLKIDAIIHLLKIIICEPYKSNNKIIFYILYIKRPILV